MPSIDAALARTLEPWAQRVRARTPLPLRIGWGDDPAAALLLCEPGTPPAVTLTLRSPAALPALLSPSLESLGEAYVEGRIDLEGSVADVIEIAWRLAETGAASAEDAQALADPAPQGSALSRLMHRMGEALRERQRHTPEADREAIQYHYDVSNDFYARWLDPAMVYSCAYFETGEETLAQAQQKKIDHILTKLRLAPGHTLLDIGCGWGALVMRAAQRFGARCLGITLSQNQYELARERLRAAGLQDRVEIRLQDYREVQGRFDRISSVGMFEHVGLANLPLYFRRIHDLLSDDGWAMNHGITSTDPANGETPYGGGRFIDRYVFPQGELPHVGTVLTTLQQGGLEAFDVENLRRHYARTLQCWSEAFEAQAEDLRRMTDERRFRIWRVYLAGCRWAFEHDHIALYQVLCRRAGRPARELPWSRRWMYAADAPAGAGPHAAAASA